MPMLLPQRVRAAVQDATTKEPLRSWYDDHSAEADAIATQAATEHPRLTQAELRGIVETRLYLARRLPPGRAVEALGAR